MFAGMDLSSLKKAFKDIYKTGPSTTKYLPEEIGILFSLLVDIKKKEAGNNLDSEFSGYKTALELLKTSLFQYTNITEPWVAMGGTIEEKMAKRSDFANETVKTRELKRLKAAFEGIEGLRKLGDLEKEDFKSIKEVLDGTRKIPEKEDQKSDLTVDELREALGASDSTKVKDDELKLAD